MSQAWPLVPLGKAALPVERPEFPLPGKAYRQIGVKLWGEGAYERETIDGGQTKYKTLSRVEVDDIIVNKIWARNGSVALVSKSLAGSYVSGEFPTFAPIRTKLEPRWFHWLTKTKAFWDQCDEKSRGTSGKNRIRPERFLEIEIPLPPLAEQRRIVARIEALAAKIAEAGGLRQQAGEEAERLLVAMAHRNDLSRETKLKACWREIAISDVCTLVDDQELVTATKSYHNLGIYSFGRGVFVKPPIEGAITSAQTLRRVKGGQFIYSRLFAFEGAYAMVPTNLHGYYVSGEYPTFDCDPEQGTPEFLWAFFKSPRVWEELAAGSKGLGHRRQRVQPDKILQHRILLPPIDWQRKISEIQVKVDALKKLQAESAAELDALLPSILDKAFKGDL